MNELGKKIEQLEGELGKVQAEIVRQTEIERRHAVVMGAYDKLRTTLFNVLTEEEIQAVSGMYLFLHIVDRGLNVDMVRNIPSGTDKGQSRDLADALSKAESVLV